MILEILDCCLIKKQLIELNEEDILNIYATEHEIENMYNILYSIASSGDSFLISDFRIIKKIRYIIGKTRFEYKNSQIKGMANSLIEYFNTYESLSKEKYYAILAQWGSEEATMHHLTKGVYYTKDVLDYIKFDYNYISYLFDNKESIDVIPTYAIASIYYLIEKFPEVFRNPAGQHLCSEKDQELLSNMDRELAFYKAQAIAKLCTIAQSRANSRTRRMAKNLVRKLETLSPIENSSDWIDKVEKQTVKKKKTN